MNRWAELFWSGCLVISIEGKSLARLLNLAARSGLRLREVYFRGNSAVAKIAPRDFKKLRPLLLKTGCRATILQKKGAPFIMLLGRRRKGLAAGLLIFSVLLYTFSLFIWRIELEGNEQVSTAEILEVLDELGAREGMLKRDLDPEEIEKALPLRMEKINWVGAAKIGTTLEIQVAEKAPAPGFEEEEIKYLVAAKDGLVEEVLVLAGRSFVEPGDTVSKGQILIAGGHEPPPDEENGYEAEEIEQVRPRGMVEARVWYEGYSEVPLVKVETRKTGDMQRSLSVHAWGKDIELWDVSDPPYPNYELEKIKRIFCWRNICLPVELLSKRYWELEVDASVVPARKAVQTAREKALKAAHAKVPRNSVIKKKQLHDFFFEEREKVGCRVLIETREDISIPGDPSLMMRDALSIFKLRYN